MLRPTRRCPKCDTMLLQEETLPVAPFPCPACHTELQASGGHAIWIVAINTLACLVISYALGFRNMHFVYVALLAWGPLLFLVVNVGRYVAPARLEVALPAITASEALRDAKRNIYEIWRDEPLELNINDKKQPR